MAEAAAAGALCARGEEEACGKGGVEALVVPAAEEEGAEDDGGGDEEEEEEGGEEGDKVEVAGDGLGGVHGDRSRGLMGTLRI